MLLVYGNEQAWDESERGQCYEDSAAIAHELRAAGPEVVAAPLQTVATATGVRVRENRRLVTDGPFAETREQLGGYFIVDARDLDEAIEIAGRLPSARQGTIEIRPILEIPGRPAH